MTLEHLSRCLGQLVHGRCEAAPPLKSAQIGGCRAIARGCRMSALCSSGEILERTEFLFEGEDPISAFFFFFYASREECYK